jgi:uncharacterized membrane protein YccC
LKFSSASVAWREGGRARITRLTVGAFIYGRYLSHSLRVWWTSAPHLLTLAYAVRGTVIMMTPFVVFLVLGNPNAAVFASLAGMYTIFSDPGGAYRRRLGAMVIAVVAGAAALFVSSILPPMVGLAPVILALVAFAGGMGRALGEAGVSTGLCMSLMFLTGLIAPQSTDHATAYTGFYAVGGLWAMGVQMALWRLRPYWILFHEVAACYEACAELVSVLSIQIAGADPGATRRRLRRRHKRAREAIRSAEATIESVRVSAAHNVPVFDRVVVWLTAASQEAAAAVSLRATTWPAPGTDASKAWETFFASWHEALMNISIALKERRRDISIDNAHAAFEALEADGLVVPETRAPLRLALQQLEIAADHVSQISPVRFGWGEDVPRVAFGGLRDVWRTLAAQLTFRSVNFRHALRVSVVSGLALWVAGILNTHYRMWLPMTAIIILQPEFGATWKRLWERVGGTLLGVLIAGSLYLVLGSDTAQVVVIVLFAYGMFFFTRSSYGLGVVMLTPLFLLLLAILNPGTPGDIFLSRFVDTLAGAALALAASWLLWPMWQRANFLPQCATAVRNERNYLAAVFALTDFDEAQDRELMRLRHLAERESDNVEASLRRMLSEPQRTRGDSRAVFGFMTFLRRLANDAIGFAVELSGGTLSPAERRQADELLGGLDTVEEVLTSRGEASRLESVQPLLATGTFAGAPLGRWFERLSVDAASLAVATRKLLHIERRRRIRRFRVLRARRKDKMRAAGP